MQLQLATLFLVMLPFALGNPLRLRQTHSATIIQNATFTQSAAAFSSLMTISYPTSSIIESKPYEPAPAPICALSCLSHAQSAQLECPPYDVECFCEAQTIAEYLVYCVTAACGESEVDEGLAFIDNFCLDYKTVSILTHSPSLITNASSTIHFTTLNTISTPSSSYGEATATSGRITTPAGSIGTGAYVRTPKAKPPHTPYATPP